MSERDDVARVADLIRGHRMAMLTTVARDGTLVSRPMGLQEVDFDGDLWFFAEHGSRKLDHIVDRPQVNVTVAGPSTWVSLTGTAAEVDDRPRMRQLWNAAAEAWFPDGPDAPGLRLLRVVATSAEYWDAPGGRLATVVRFVTARLSGEPVSLGDNARVRLS